MECERAVVGAVSVEVVGHASSDVVTVVGKLSKVGDKAHANMCGKVSMSPNTGMVLSVVGSNTSGVYADLLCSDAK